MIFIIHQVFHIENNIFRDVSVIKLMDKNSHVLSYFDFKIFPFIVYVGTCLNCYAFTTCHNNHFILIKLGDDMKFCEKKLQTITKISITIL